DRHGARQLMAPLGKTREGLEAEIHIGLDLRAGLWAERAEQQVFLDGKLGKQPAALRHQCYPEIYDLLGVAADQIVLFTIDLGDYTSLFWAHDSHDALHQRALSVAVGPEQDNSFASSYRDRDVFDDADGAVRGVYAFDGQTTGQGTPSRLRDPGHRLSPCRQRFSCRSPAQQAAARSSLPHS